MAVNAGVRVIATTRDRNSFSIVEKLGAERCEIERPDLSKHIAEAKKIDRVLDLVGNSVLLDSLAMLRRGGRSCLAGFLGGLAPVPDFNPLLQMSSGVHLSFFRQLRFRHSGLSALRRASATDRGGCRGRPPRCQAIQDLPLRGDPRGSSSDGGQRSARQDGSRSRLRRSPTLGHAADEAFSITVLASRSLITSDGRAGVPEYRIARGNPEIPGLEAAWRLTHIDAAHLIVLGGGYVGLEMAQAYRRFGSRVTSLRVGLASLAGKTPTSPTKSNKYLSAKRPPASNSMHEAGVDRAQCLGDRGVRRQPEVLRTRRSTVSGSLGTIWPCRRPCSHGCPAAESSRV